MFVRVCGVCVHMHVFTQCFVTVFVDRMTKLLKVAADVEYVDLTVSFVNPDGGDDVAGPPVRYLLK